MERQVLFEDELDPSEPTVPVEAPEPIVPSQRQIVFEDEVQQPEFGVEGFTDPQSGIVFDPVVPEPVENPNRPKLTANDLQANYMPEVRDFLSAMRGFTEDDLTDEEAVDKFLQLNRWYAVNIGSQGRNLSVINSASEEDLQKIGAGLSLFQSMENIFSGENTWGETLSGAGDYAAGIILDPANLVSWGVGKVVASGGARVAVQAARQQAMKKYQEALLRGATPVEAYAVSQEAAQGLMRNALADEVAESTARQTSRSARNILERRGIQATIGFDAVVAAGGEAAYQAGHIRAGVQEDMNWASTGLAALGVLAVGGLALAGQTKSVGRLPGTRPGEASDLANFTQGEIVRPTREFTEKALDDALVTMGSWQEKVRAGTELSDLDTDFWKKFTYGDDELGIKGVLQTFVDAGYVWERRANDDNFMNWVTDVLTQGVSDEYATKFLQSYQRLTGKELPELSRLTYTNLVNSYARKMSDAGSTLAGASIAARRLGKPVAKVTKDDIDQVVRESLEATVPGTKNYWSRIAGEGSGRRAMDGFLRFQNNTIRMIVANPATSALNLKGWGFTASYTVMTDIVKAGLYGGASGLALVAGKKGDAMEYWNKAWANASANIRRFRTLIDPNTTYEVFRSYLAARPEEMRRIAEVGVGGVDVQNQVGLGPFDPTMSRLGRGMETFVDKVQYASMVQSVDGFTKSQEWFAQLDKQIRLKYKRPMMELFADPDRRRIMNTPEYMELEAKALTDTLRNLYAASYAGRGTLGTAASIMENLRNVPVIGMLVPFGRFFNNSVAFMAETSGVGLAAKYLGGKFADRSYGDLIIRTAVTWGLVMSLVDNEENLLEQGFGTFEERSMLNGDVIDTKFDFPYSMVKAAARIVAYARRNEDVPQEEMNSIMEAVAAFDDWVTRVPPGVIGETFEAAGGQVFRQLQDAAESSARFLTDYAEGNVDSMEFVGALVGAPSGAVVSGWTRFLEPYNSALALARDTDWQTMDRKQGSEMINQHLRYSDQLVDVLLGYDTVAGERPEQAYTAAGGASRVGVGKFFLQREGQSMTNTERVMNFMGIRTWTLDSRTPVPEGDNRFDRLLHSLIEREAEKFWNDPRFKTNKGWRDSRWEEIVNDSKERVRDIMESGIDSSGSQSLAVAMRVMRDLGEAEVKRTMQELGVGDKDISDLTMAQLLMIQSWSKNRSKLRGY